MIKLLVESSSSTTTSTSTTTATAAATTTDSTATTSTTTTKCYYYQNDDATDNCSNSTRWTSAPVSRVMCRVTCDVPCDVWLTVWRGRLDSKLVLGWSHQRSVHAWCRRSRPGILSARSADRVPCYHRVPAVRRHRGRVSWTWTGLAYGGACTRTWCRLCNTVIW